MMDFSKISRLLINLLAKYVSFTFDNQCLIAWEKLRKNLSPHQSFLPWIGQSHSRWCAMLLIFFTGTVLGQYIDNKKHIIYYSSRTPSDAQLSYNTIKKEFLAMVFALEKFHPYLGRKPQFSLINLCLNSSCLRRIPKPDSFVGFFFFKNLITRFEIKKA